MPKDMQYKGVKMQHMYLPGMFDGQSFCAAIPKLMQQKKCVNRHQSKNCG